MLPKENRLTTLGVKESFKKGRVLGTQNLKIRFILQGKKQKISCIVPKSVSRRAIDRNLLKRRGYVVIRKYLKNIPQNIVGAIIFGNNSLKTFGGRKNKENNPIFNLNNEIKELFSKIH